MITDSFPPDISGRAVQMTKRVKYLYKFGWETEVLTPRISNKKKVDVSLLKEIPYPVNIYRTRYILEGLLPSLKYNKLFMYSLKKNFYSRIKQLLFVPKGYIRWIPMAIIKGLSIISQRKIKIIYTMNNPVALHLIGYILKKITGKPWVAEFRDPWYGYEYNTKGPEIINKILEREVVKYADRILLYTGYKINEKYFFNNYPDIPKDKFIKLPYLGYDPEDFINIKINKKKNKKLNIFYAGSFYGGESTPLYFLKGLENFIKSKSISDQNIEVIFAGDWCDEYTRFVKRLGLEDENIVKIKGYISRQKCIDGYINADLLLLIIGKEGGNECVPSKFWDYVGAQKPILALVPPNGKVAEIINKENLGIVVPSTDIFKISKALELFFEKFSQGTLNYCASAKFLESITREKSERRFVEVLDDIITEIYGKKFKL